MTARIYHIAYERAWRELWIHLHSADLVAAYLRAYDASFGKNKPYELFDLPDLGEYL